MVQNQLRGAQLDMQSTSQVLLVVVVMIGGRGGVNLPWQGCLG
jgi:hypothetical protein